jgi:uncharacterized membrane protein YraQ (UPF0718 family)
MFDQIFEIGNFILSAFWHIWPYLLITIPMAVAVRMSGASQYISRAFQARPVIAIFLATAVGAFSPFCSCGVIPVIAAMLIGGVPLAPVMSFWIASPSMDPEIFFLSVATLGWELAVWRLGATLVLSLSAGFITHLLMQRGWLGQQVLRKQPATSAQSTWSLLKSGWRKAKDGLALSTISGFMAGRGLQTSGVACCIPAAEIMLTDTREPAPPSASNCGCATAKESSCGIAPVSFQRRLFSETWSATLMVAKFMALAFFLEALITLYVPSEWIAGLLGPDNPWAIVTAALIGVPVYTSNMAALAMVGGLLTQGMNPAAALAFLIAGPTTTIPAMAAVWGLTSRRVFVLYIAFSLVGAVSLGYLYGLVLALS